jgi:hypothetical protein
MPPTVLFTRAIETLAQTPPVPLDDRGASRHENSVD